MKIVNVNGGIGRIICATGAIAKLAEDEDVSVLTSTPNLFQGLGCERVYPLNHAYLYEDIMKDNELLEPEPYNRMDYYRDEKHLCQVFNKLINGVDEMVMPKISLTKNELIEAKNLIGDKKVILYQPWGSMGGFCTTGKIEDVKDDDSHRSLGTQFAKKLYLELIKNYTVYVIKGDNQVGFGGCQTFQQADIRKIIALIPYTKAVIGCDSFLHHAASCFDTKTIVLWAGSNEKNLGYEKQVNLREHKCEFAPMRISHSNEYYLDKNKNSNEFSDSMITKVMENL
jgi:hypothetical protein